jgi:hypothetical protein
MLLLRMALCVPVTALRELTKKIRYVENSRIFISILTNPGVKNYNKGLV